MRARMSFSPAAGGGRPGWLGCGLALLVAGLACLGQPPPAWAHASLVGSDPPAGATLAEPPTTLRLDFNEPVSPLVVRLVGPTGEAVMPAVRAENSTLAITPGRLARGTHVLSWRGIPAAAHT